MSNMTIDKRLILGEADVKRLRDIEGGVDDIGPGGSARRRYLRLLRRIIGEKGFGSHYICHESNLNANTREVYFERI